MANADEATLVNQVNKLLAALTQNGSNHNETKEQVSTLTTQLNVVQRDLTNIDQRFSKELNTLSAHFTSQITDVSKSIEGLRAELTGKRTSPWTIALTATALLSLLGTFLFTVIALQVGSGIAPINTKLAELTTELAQTVTKVDLVTGKSAEHDTKLIGALNIIGVLQNDVGSIKDSLRIVEQMARSSVAADANSATNRTQINADVERLKNDLSKEIGLRQSQTAEINARFVEVETQFKGASNINNVQHAHDLRMLGVLWLKLYGTPYPEFSFYPGMFNDHPSSITGTDGGTTGQH